MIDKHVRRYSYYVFIIFIVRVC